MWYETIINLLNLKPKPMNMTRMSTYQLQKAVLRSSSAKAKLFQIMISVWRPCSIMTASCLPILPTNKPLSTLMPTGATFIHCRWNTNIGRRSLSMTRSFAPNWLDFDPLIFMQIRLEISLKCRLTKDYIIWISNQGSKKCFWCNSSLHLMNKCKFQEKATEAAQGKAWIPKLWAQTFCYNGNGNCFFRHACILCGSQHPKLQCNLDTPYYMPGWSNPGYPPPPPSKQHFKQSKPQTPNQYYGGGRPTK